MEDPTFSELISFICLSDSQFIWLPVLNSVPTTVLPQKKGHKDFLRRKQKKPEHPQIQHKNRWEQNLSSHDIKCELVPYIQTQLCRLRGTEHGDFGVEFNQLFASFQRKNKGAKVVLNMNWKIKSLNKSPHNQQHFLASNEKQRGESRREERSRSTLIINRSSTAYGNSDTGGVGSFKMH